MSEKIKLTNEQILNIRNIAIEGDKLEICFTEKQIAELDELFDNKGIIQTIRVYTEADEQTASYSGYTNYISITKDKATTEIKVLLGKENQTQVEIEELKRQVNELTEIVASKL